MRRRLLPWLLCSLVAALALGGAPPAPPEATYPLVDDLTYPDAKAARAAWKPMWGTEQVAVVELGGRRALRMPCNFKGTAIERASWDRAVTLDLTACRGLQFSLHCADVLPISSFSLYLHSGDGWYAARFGKTAARGWSRVVIDKTDTRIEGRPAGWGAVDTIRISAWRGRDVDTELHIANLGLLGADAPIAIIRGESVAKTRPDEVNSVNTFAKAVAEGLDALGLSYAVISDLDANAERLKGKSLAILPHNPAMPDAVADVLADFVKRGGKLVAFYTLSGKLGETVGIAGGAHVPQTYRGHFASIRATGDGLAGLPPVVGQRSWNVRDTRAVEGRSRVAALWFNDKGQSTGRPAIVVSDNCVFLSHVLLADDLATKRRLLLAMVGHFVPDLWKQAAERSIGRIGTFGPYADFDAAAAGIRKEAEGSKPALLTLELAGALRQEARERLAKGQFPKVVKLAATARDDMVRAHCQAQKPQAGEHRAWWCHSAFGVAGMTWDEAIKTLADNGFTAILPNMLWGGTAYYTSKILPVAPEVADKGDQIALCLAACKKHGVQCHVWKVNWNMSHRAPKDFAERMAREGRTQVTFDGRPERRWLCPSHPDNQRLEIDSMVEVATNYQVHGIHFDYIRYPGPQGCYCPGCQARFEKLIGRKLGNWPADLRRDKALEAKWLDFRRTNITTVVATVHERVRKLGRPVKVSAAVFRNWPIDRDKVGQDWKLWCDRGYLDFVCPMDYTPNNVQFETMITQQRAWTGKVPCYPGIGLSVWGPARDVVKLIEQIKITRRLGTGGFTIFNYGAPEAGHIAPLCGLGITRHPKGKAP